MSQKKYDGSTVLRSRDRLLAKKIADKFKAECRDRLNVIAARTLRSSESISQVASRLSTELGKAVETVAVEALEDFTHFISLSKPEEDSQNTDPAAADLAFSLMATFLGDIVMSFSDDAIDHAAFDFEKKAELLPRIHTVLQEKGYFIAVGRGYQIKGVGQQIFIYYCFQLVEEELVVTIDQIDFKQNQDIAKTKVIPLPESSTIH
jgi:hypothetical protein